MHWEFSMLGRPVPPPRLSGDMRAADPAHGAVDELDRIGHRLVDHDDTDSLVDQALQAFDALGRFEKG